jgi:hypothetical protein
VKRRRPFTYRPKGESTISKLSDRVICNGCKIWGSRFATVANNFATVAKPSAMSIVYICGMKNFMDSKSAAAVYGFGICRLNQIAKERGIKPITLGGSQLWSVPQVLKLKPKANGRPKGSTNRKAKK